MRNATEAEKMLLIRTKSSRSRTEKKSYLKIDQSQSNFLLLSNCIKKDKEDIKSKLNEYYEKESSFYLDLCKINFPKN